MRLFTESRRVPVTPNGSTVHAQIQCYWHRDSGTLVANAMRGDMLTSPDGGHSFTPDFDGQRLDGPTDEAYVLTGFGSQDDARAAAFRWAVQKADEWFATVSREVRLVPLPGRVIPITHTARPSATAAAPVPAASESAAPARSPEGGAHGE